MSPACTSWWSPTAAAAQIAALLDGGSPPPAIDSVFALEEAVGAFERSLAAGKRGKVVLEVAR